LNLDIKQELKEIINNLKIVNHKNLDKIFLEINDNKNIEIINLKSGKKVDISSISKSNLLIKMNFDTFKELKNNKKSPEDLLFEEKIKISGDINLLQ
jgi:hypothetical protein|tara:strand:+ start:716 stop:1006 length:291 start_codon:yes stop_codon:yes gene_type:complete